MRVGSHFIQTMKEMSLECDYSLKVADSSYRVRPVREMSGGSRNGMINK